MAKPHLRKLMRVIHYWVSLAMLLTGGLVAVTGILLLLKKDVALLQPPVAAGSVAGAADVGVDALFDAASDAAATPLSWSEIDRIDVRPSDGIAKVVTDEALEYQVDLHTLEVLSIGHRGADIIEQIHDGSVFSDAGKYLVMLPSGAALLILWASGVYLFFLPRFLRWRRALR